MQSGDNRADATAATSSSLPQEALIPNAMFIGS